MTDSVLRLAGVLLREADCELRDNLMASELSDKIINSSGKGKCAFANVYSYVHMTELEIWSTKATFHPRWQLHMGSEMKKHVCEGKVTLSIVGLACTSG